MAVLLLLLPLLVGLVWSHCWKLLGWLCALAAAVAVGGQLGQLLQPLSSHRDGPGSC